jgi:hypothetical protein
MNTVVAKEFFFLLDAWQYCRQHNLPLERIKRQDWKTWVVK